MEHTVFVKNYKKEDSAMLSNINTKEVLRYAGYMMDKGDATTTSELLEKLSEATSDALNILNYKVCYSIIDISWDNDIPVLPFKTTSKGLAKCLSGSDKVVMFAATIGLSLDRLIARNQRVDMTKTLFLQALGAERVEALCDTFCEDFRENFICKELGESITPRFSPGYGDLPLVVQRDFFNILDCNRKIGISLNESLLMTPSKSVTAIFGIKSGEWGKRNETSTLDKINNKCLECSKIDCTFRKII